MIVVILPVGEPGIESDCVQIDGGVELFQIRSLRAFNFPVQVRRCRLHRPKLDHIFLQLVLDRIGEKLSSAIRLNALNRER